MDVKKSKKNALIAASIAGLMAITGIAATNSVVYADDVNCYGVNACKGNGDCGGKGSSCHGSNACKGQGWVKTSADLCKKIGGTTTPKE